MSCVHQVWAFKLFRPTVGQATTLISGKRCLPGRPISFVFAQQITKCVVIFTYSVFIVAVNLKQLKVNVYQFLNYLYDPQSSNANCGDKTVISDLRWYTSDR